MFISAQGSCRWVWGSKISFRNLPENNAFEFLAFLIGLPENNAFEFLAFLIGLCFQFFKYFPKILFANFPGIDIGMYRKSPSVPKKRIVRMFQCLMKIVRV